MRIVVQTTQPGTLFEISGPDSDGEYEVNRAGMYLKVDALRRLHSELERHLLLLEVEALREKVEDGQNPEMTLFRKWVEENRP